MPLIGACAWCFWDGRPWAPGEEGNALWDRKVHSPWRCVRNFWPFRILRVLLLPATGVLVVEEGGSTGHLDHMRKVAAKARRQSVDQKARAMDKEAEQEALEAGKLQPRTLEQLNCELCSPALWNNSIAS